MHTYAKPYVKRDYRVNAWLGCVGISITSAAVICPLWCVYIVNQFLIT